MAFGGGGPQQRRGIIWPPSIKYCAFFCIATRGPRKGFAEQIVSLRVQISMAKFFLAVIAVAFALLVGAFVYAAFTL